VPYAEEITDFKLEFPVNVKALRFFSKIFRIDHDIDRFRLILASQKSVAFPFPPSRIEKVERPSILNARDFFNPTSNLLIIEVLDFQDIFLFFESNPHPITIHLFIILFFSS
jgi:hypothetical protein